MILFTYPHSDLDTQFNLYRHGDFTTFATDHESLLPLELAHHGSFILIIAIIVFQALRYPSFLLCPSSPEPIHSGCVSDRLLFLMLERRICLPSDSSR